LVPRPTTNNFMNAKYLGETAIDIASHHRFKNYTPKDWAMYFISSYGQIEGDHHSKWVLDQAARALHGGVPEVKLAKWDNGYEEERVQQVPATQAYLDWVKEMKGEITIDEDGEEEPEYTYDEGIAP